MAAKFDNVDIRPNIKKITLLFWSNLNNAVSQLLAENTLHQNTTVGDLQKLSHEMVKRYTSKGDPTMQEITIRIKTEDRKVFDPKAKEYIDPDKCPGYAKWVQQEIREALDLGDTDEIHVTLA